MSEGLGNLPHFFFEFGFWHSAGLVSSTTAERHVFLAERYPAWDKRDGGILSQIALLSSKN